ncbi:phage portal protein [Escherichia coli]|nr:phage portal protein [Escherichia coli]EHR9096951.1 phage portal protein [Escherichia coli]EIM2919086.1 phage portal protein [Escherichia coli]EIM2935048.1 phage portal protein [Escherichia coli]EIM2940353.1 phage portal protein [Escherichia coli]
MKKNRIEFLDHRGEPLIPAGGKTRALNGESRIPYDAADWTHGASADWHPFLGSPDTEINLWRNRMVARIRDLVRNDGWASGSITRLLDNAVGVVFRPRIKPDYRMLAAVTGNRAFDAAWADEYGRVVEAHWRMWADNAGCWCDLERRLTLPQIFRLAFRHKLVDGDALAVLHWMPERIAPGRARYATVVQVVDPDRLGNPGDTFDRPHIRGGVEINDNGEPVAYHIRKAHVGDWWSGRETMEWERVPRETAWGRPLVVHDFDHDRAGQHRGTGILTPVVQRMKMLIRYDQSELEAAILNAVFGAYITSPFDQTLVEDAMSEHDIIGGYQKSRMEFHSEHRIRLPSGAHMPVMHPGEEINTVNAARPVSNFKDFESAVLRNVSAALGLSTQQVTQDWSEVNYSSARAALLEAWKTLTRRRDEFAMGFAQPVLCAFLEELHEEEDLPLPAGAPDFLAFRAAYCRANWMGPGRGWVDPVAEKKGAILAMESGLSTLESEVSENAGEDWEDVLDQRAREEQAFRERGLTPPSWLAAERFAPTPPGNSPAEPEEPDVL